MPYSKFNNDQFWGRTRRNNLLQKMRFVYSMPDFSFLVDQFINWLNLWKVLLNLSKGFFGW